MKTLVTTAVFLGVVLLASAQKSTRKHQVQSAQTAEKRSQAVPPKTQPFGSEAFNTSSNTTIRWLGNGGFFINSRGTTLMVDPLLKGFDMPLLFDMPVAPENVPRLDAVLITHRDNDHYSVPTCRALARVCRAYHSTQLVAYLMKKEGLPATGHNIGGMFKVGQVGIKLTPADHNYRPVSKKQDDSGFWMETPDGTIWAPVIRVSYRNTCACLRRMPSFSIFRQ